MIYTIRNRCDEVPELPYEDGARTIYLYTRGKKGNPSKELRELLNYMEKSTTENVRTDKVRKIHQMVQRIKEDRKAGVAYMTVLEKLEMIKDEGREEGRAEERKNTMLEKKRADEESNRAETEKKRADILEKELLEAKRILAKIKHQQEQNP